MTIKLDLEKAYDLLNWDFIKYVLLRFGFHFKWVKLGYEVHYLCLFLHLDKWKCSRLILS